MLIALVFCPFYLSAQDTPIQSQSAVWIVDQNYILLNSEMGEELLKREEAAFEALKAEDEKQTEELQSQEADLAIRREQMTSEDFAVLAKEFSEKVEKTRSDFLVKEQIRLRTNSIWRQRFDSILVGISRTIATQNGVKMILDSDTVIWSDPSIDFSPSLVAVLDREYIKNPNIYNEILFAPVENTQPESDSVDNATSQIENEINKDNSNDASQ